MRDSFTRNKIYATMDKKPELFVENPKNDLF